MDADTSGNGVGASSRDACEGGQRVIGQTERGRQADHIGVPGIGRHGHGDGGVRVDSDHIALDAEVRVFIALCRDGCRHSDGEDRQCCHHQVLQCFHGAILSLGLVLIRCT